MDELRQEILDTVRTIARHEPELGHALKSPLELIFGDLKTDEEHLQGIRDALQRYAVLFELAEL